MGMVALVSALALFLIPSQPMEKGQRMPRLDGHHRPIAGEDDYLPVCSCLDGHGLGIIMTLPLRIEYLSGERRSPFNQ